MDADSSQYRCCGPEYKEEEVEFCHLYRGQHRLDNSQYLSWYLCPGRAVPGLYRSIHLGLDRMGQEGMDSLIRAGWKCPAVLLIRLPGE